MVSGLLLHIDALLLDLFYGVQGKFLKIFGINHQSTQIWKQPGPPRMIRIARESALEGSPYCAAFFGQANPEWIRITDAVGTRDDTDHTDYAIQMTKHDCRMTKE